VSQEVFASIEANPRLYLANNNLAFLPSTLFDLTNLRSLGLRNNKLTEIPSAIGQLVNLETLNIVNNDLQFLPYEILDLARFGKLSKFEAALNPWMEPGLEDILSEGDSAPIEVSSDLAWLQFKIHQIRKDAESRPVYFRNDGSPESQTSLSIRQRQVSASSTVYVRSLTETVLVHLLKSQPLGDLLEEMHGLPKSVYKLLAAVRDQQQNGRQKCTTCRRETIIPRKQWIEWWTFSSRMDRPSGRGSRNNLIQNFEERYPFLRRQCSTSCVPIPNTVNGSEMPPSNECLARLGLD